MGTDDPKNRGRKKILQMKKTSEFKKESCCKLKHAGLKDIIRSEKRKARSVRYRSPPLSLVPPIISQRWRDRHHARRRRRDASRAGRRRRRPIIPRRRKHGAPRRDRPSGGGRGLLTKWRVYRVVHRRLRRRVRATTVHHAWHGGRRSSAAGIRRAGASARVGARRRRHKCRYRC